MTQPITSPAATTVGRRGIALPAAIMALVLLSALVAGALYVSTEELRAGRGDLATERALAAAESALERAVVSWNSQRNTSLTVGTSAIVERWSSGSGDRADVTATRVGLKTVWLTAAATSGADGRTIPARRTIAASLRLVGPRFPLTAALTAAGKVTIRDATVDGQDVPAGGELPAACADEPNADASGVLLRDALLACGATCSGGAPAGVTGSPPVAVDASLTSAIVPFGDDTRATLARRADLVLAAGTYVPRPTIAGDSCKVEDPSNWGDPGGGVCGNLFRIIHVRGDAVLGAGSVGQGVLVLDGTLRVQPGASFAGVVIAANDIEVVGAAASITGVAFTSDTDGAGGSLVADGAKVRFSSCVVRRTALGVARLTHTPGRWWAELR